MLPRELAEAVGLAYLLMRIVDTLEDAPDLAEPQRADRLLMLEESLAGIVVDPPAPLVYPALLRMPLGELPAERALMADSARVLAAIARLPGEHRRAIAACAQTMSRGVRMMLTRAAGRGLAYPGNRSADELREYCYYVAGVVGEMLCAMMSHYLRQPALLRLREIAVELGIGLQLVNILKDALKDAEHGRRYLPIAADGGVASAEITRMVLNEARQSLRRGAEFVLALPATARELRSFCGLPIAWGAMTLSKAEQDGARAKIDRGAIGASIELFRSLAGDDIALREWFARLLGDKVELARR